MSMYVYYNLIFTNMCTIYGCIYVLCINMEIHIYGEREQKRENQFSYGGKILA